MTVHRPYDREQPDHDLPPPVVANQPLEPQDQRGREREIRGRDNEGTE